MFSFIKRYFLGLLVLLVALIVLFYFLAAVAGHAPAPFSNAARWAESHAQAHG